MKKHERSIDIEKLIDKFIKEHCKEDLYWCVDFGEFRERYNKWLIQYKVIPQGKFKISKQVNERGYITKVRRCTKKRDKPKNKTIMFYSSIVSIYGIRWNEKF